MSREMTRGARRVLGWLVMLWMLALTAPAQATRTMTSILTNAQGTVVAKMDAAGNMTYTAAYRPYGKQQTGAPQAEPGYTGHVNDPDTGLVYMQARYYDLSGRFLSIDPAGATPGNIFSFNRYAYVDSNPVINTDPTGMHAASEGDDVCMGNNECIAGNGGGNGSSDDFLMAGSEKSSQAYRPTDINGDDEDSQKLSYITQFGSDHSPQWDIIFILRKPSKNGGWIVQHIEATSLYPPYSSVSYWEAWAVLSGGKTSPMQGITRKGVRYNDEFVAPYGSIATGTARFYEGLKLPSSFRVHNDPSFPAGNLPSTFTNPHLPSASATKPLVRSWINLNTYKYFGL